MGLNRMMMGNGRVKVEDGSKFWTYSEANNKTISFTVPPGVNRIKVKATVDYAENEEFLDYAVMIKNSKSGEKWGEGYSTCEVGNNIAHLDIDSVVGVTPNKTYTLLFDCYDTSGVTFSWGKAINAMTPTVEDY